MRKIFEFLANFDWITPSIGLLEDLINDPTLLQSNSWTFFIPYDRTINNGWNASDIEGLMKRHGIKTWGGQITGGEYFFSVKLEQAQWAEYVLSRYGIPLTELSQGSPRPKRERKQQSRQKNQSFLDDLLEGDLPPFWR